MADYRRAFSPGGTFFFTLVTSGRAPLFRDEATRILLRGAIESCRRDRPFSLSAIVLLHDHLHMIMKLPNGDANFSSRLAAVKAGFTRQYLVAGGTEKSCTRSQIAHRHRGIWQRRFWEHMIRDEEDLNNHLNYIHYNPVKHGLVACPHAWSYSSFDRFVRQRMYEPDWLCTCGGRTPKLLDFADLAGVELD